MSAADNTHLNPFLGGGDNDLGAPGGRGGRRPPLLKRLINMAFGGSSPQVSIWAVHGALVVGAFTV